jgi:hypothetical protein
LGAAYPEVRGLGLDGESVYLKHGIAGFFADENFHAANDMGKVLDLFNNPVGYLTSPGKMLCILLFLSGCCLKTEVFKQLY